MANQKAWIKTGVVDDPDMGQMPDFKGQQVSGWAQIASDSSGWLGVVCADTDALTTLGEDDGVSVWLNVGDEDIINNVIAEAQAMGADESAVRNADVYCDVE